LGGVSNNSSKPDLNQQIASLDERKVRLTFRDIWIDYQNFRRNYYFYQIESPKEIYAKNEQPVDVDKFKVSRWGLDLFKNRDRHAYLSPSWFFVRIIMMIVLFKVWRVLRWPIEKYQDWEDPLKP
jgi:hypothetical protein